MSLKVIPIFWFEFLSDFWRKSQNGAKKENCANQDFAAAKAASSRRGQGPKMATHGFAAAKQCFATAKQCFATVKTLFTVGQSFMLFPKVMYSCTDSLGTLINYQWGSK